MPPTLISSIPRPIELSKPMPTAADYVERDWQLRIPSMRTRRSAEPPEPLPQEGAPE